MCSWSQRGWRWCIGSNGLFIKYKKWKDSNRLRHEEEKQCASHGSQLSYKISEFLTEIQGRISLERKLEGAEPDSETLASVVDVITVESDHYVKLEDFEK